MWQLNGNARSMGFLASSPLPVDPFSSCGGNDVPEAQQSQNFTLFAAETITVDPHCQLVIRVPHAQPMENRNVLVEPAFTLFLRGITASRVLTTLDKTWIPVMLLYTGKHAVSLPRSFSLVHCEVLEDQTVLCGSSIPGSLGSKSEATQLTEKQLGELVASLGIRHIHLSTKDTDEVIALIREYEDVFASSDVDIGRTGVVQHTINTGRSRYQAEAPSDSLLGGAQTGGGSSETPGCRSNSAIQFPLSIADCAGSDVRMGVDLRKLTLATKKDCFALPLLDETLDA